MACDICLKRSWMVCQHCHRQFCKQCWLAHLEDVGKKKA